MAVFADRSRRGPIRSTYINGFCHVLFLLFLTGNQPALAWFIFGHHKHKSDPTPIPETSVPGPVDPYRLKQPGWSSSSYRPGFANH